MTDRELMQMALDWLDDGCGKYTDDYQNVIDALRTRLAQPEPEPVAWVAYENGEKHGIDFDEDEIAELPVGTMLYTVPPQREWQDLTDDESDEIWGECLGVFDCLKMTQAKLKEKNT
jgi:hypothetical protein